MDLIRYEACWERKVWWMVVWWVVEVQQILSVLHSLAQSLWPGSRAVWMMDDE